MEEYTRVGPGLPPLCGERASMLLLGSFPSPKSRAQGFYYGHPQNRFWPLMAWLTGAETPKWDAISDKKQIILQNGFAVWDVIRSCEIRGASDSSIRAVEPNDLEALIRRLGVQAVFCNGGTAAKLYRRYALPKTGLEAVTLPSTSPANAAWTMPRLRQRWGEALAPWLPGGKNHCNGAGIPL